MTKTRTIADVQAAIRAGDIRPGDCVLFDRSEAGANGLVWRGIAYCQPKMLRQLYCRPQRADMRRRLALSLLRFREPLTTGYLVGQAIRDASRFVHVGTVIDADHYAEMTSPRARLSRWEEVPGGTRLRIRRALSLECEELSVETGEAIAEWAAYDAAMGVPYPTGEILLHYGWRWGIQRLFLGRRFAKVFRSDKRDVCSGSWWRYACQSHDFAGLNAPGMDQYPEAWYPARLALDVDYLSTVAEVTICASGDSFLPSSLAPGAQPSLNRRSPAQCPDRQPHGPGSVAPAGTPQYAHTGVRGAAPFPTQEAFA